ncbi:terminase TerL endonuclease subunit, partial [Klebsiella variicola]
NTDDLFVGKTLLHGDVLMWLMKTLLTSGCTNQRGAGQQDSGLWMPHSIELFEQMLDDGVIIIKTNPCLRWNAASAVTEADQKENRIFAKKKSTGRIDGVVASAMAIGAAEGYEPDDGDIEGFFDDPIIVGI